MQIGNVVNDPMCLADVPWRYKRYPGVEEPVVLQPTWFVAEKGGIAVQQDSLGVVYTSAAYPVVLSDGSTALVGSPGHHTALGVAVVAGVAGGTQSPLP